MTQENTALLEALKKARSLFERYGKEHRAKAEKYRETDHFLLEPYRSANADASDRKAETNEAMVAEIDAALSSPTQSSGEAELLDRAERAWQRFFYPAADCFSGPIGDKLPSVDLEVADCLRLVLASVGRLVVTPDGDVPAPTTDSLTADAAALAVAAWRVDDLTAKGEVCDSFVIFTDHENVEEHVRKYGARHTKVTPLYALAQPKGGDQS